MTESRQYFLCGIGGSGMLPLALILKARGFAVEGSDRALDQGRTGAKFDYLAAQGIGLHPQDGSGMRSADQILVASAAVEETVPDVVAAKALGAPRLSRAALLSKLFNASAKRIGVAGTSGKSTTTAMIAWILHSAECRPTVMNGAVMKNFATKTALFASALVGDGDIFLSELDESDGSIAMFDPTIAVLNNISLDHKSMDELRALFGDFVAKAQTAVFNLDNPETAALAKGYARNGVTYSLAEGADFGAKSIEPAHFGVSFTAIDRRTHERARIALKMPGRHNVSNALAAIATAKAGGVAFVRACEALCSFEGVKRRLEWIGEAKGVVVIDDFGHNPDKIAASLSTLHEFPGRLIVLFQPHGYGPLRKMREEFIDCFAKNLAKDDSLFMPEPAYFGGTVDKSVSSQDIVSAVVDRGRKASALATREACGDAIVKEVAPGDRIVVMGARDDTLSQFASDLVNRLR